MRRLAVWLVGFLVAAAAAVMAAAPDASARATVPAADSGTGRPRDMGAAIALVERLQP